MNGNSTRRVQIEAAGEGVVPMSVCTRWGRSRTGSGLGDALSARIPPAGERLPLHDRGKVLVQAMLMLAGGGEACADIEALRVQEEVGSFVDEVESATGQPVVFYVGDDLAGGYEFRSDRDRPIWHRRILIHPEFDDWWIWQFSGRSSVDGIEGDAELNVMRGAAPGTRT